eukprot:scaffold492_cov257-Pinguiococcus_pyrenoidosus.AAC.38
MGRKSGAGVRFTLPSGERRNVNVQGGIRNQECIWRPFRSSGAPSSSMRFPPGNSELGTSELGMPASEVPIPESRRRRSLSRRLFGELRSPKPAESTAAAAEAFLRLSTSASAGAAREAGSTMYTARTLH